MYLPGARIRLVGIGDPIRLAGGRGQDTAGIGIHMNHLDGQPTIMEGGFTTTTMAGFGYLITNGDLPG